VHLPDEANRRALLSSQKDLAELSRCLANEIATLTNRLAPLFFRQPCNHPSHFPTKIRHIKNFVLDRNQLSHLLPGSAISLSR